MNGARWCTKEDVVKDLAKANGAKLHIDNSYLVVGERPPPIPVSDIDEEMELFFGDVIAKDQKPMEVTVSPDLKGITQMIRMVEKYDDSSSSSSECDSKVCATRPKLPYDIIRISKLNPNVREFNPKDEPTSPVAVNKSESPKRTETNEKVNTDKLDQPISKKTINCDSDKRTNQFGPKAVDVNSNDISKNIANVNGQNSNEFQNIAAALKAKIQQTSNANNSTFQMKKERNVAIANLQKLLSMQAQEPTPKETTKVVKLITPDYYEHAKPMSEDIESLDDKPKVDNISHALSNECSESTTPINYKLLNKKFNSGPNAGLETTASDPGEPKKHPKPETTAHTTGSHKIHNGASAVLAESDIELSNPQVRNSIEKVNCWLNKNEAKPVASSPPINAPTREEFLSSFTFKRKETRKSPNVTEKKIPKPAQDTIEQYKPSEYAEELSKMYMERVKKIETHAQKCRWDNLDQILKEKDEKLKQERLKKDNDNADSKSQ